jgi:hypothetical protein
MNGSMAVVISMVVIINDDYHTTHGQPGDYMFGWKGDSHHAMNPRWSSDICSELPSQSLIDYEMHHFAIYERRCFGNGCKLES